MIQISVIVPFFGAKERLDKLVETLKRQSLSREKWELIVVDNHCNQCVFDCEDYRVIHQRVPGSYAARNEGIDSANGKYLFFTDSDCLVQKDWLEIGLNEALLSDSIIAGKITLKFRDQERPLGLELYERIFYFHQRSYFENQGYGATANLVVPKKVFEKVGPFDAALRSGGDQEFCQRAVKEGATLIFCEELNVFHPSRADWKSFIIRRIRSLAGNIFLQYRSEGFTWRQLREKWSFFWKLSQFKKWDGDWDFYYSLSESDQLRVRRCHWILTRVDLLILILCKLSYRSLKFFTMIDRKFN